MSFRTAFSKSCLAFAVMSLSVLLTACQVPQMSEALDVQQGTKVPAADNSPLREETIGSGRTKLALLLAFSGPDVGQSIAIRNGAILALEVLAGQDISLKIVNASDQATSAATLSAFGPHSIGVAGGIAAQGSGVMVVFDRNDAPRPSGAFAFLSSTMDSQVAVLRSIANDDDKIVVFSGASSASRAYAARFKAAGLKASIVTYEAGEMPAAIVAKANADMTIAAFPDSDSAVPAIVSELRQKRGAQLKVVGNPDWESKLLPFAAAEGAIVARPDTGNHALIAKRYLARFGVPATENALYGFDYIAVMLGITLTKGGAVPTREDLLISSGFKGATGAFRFRKDGTVDRLFELSVVKGQKLTLLQKAQEGF